MVAELKERARNLGLWSIVSNWSEYAESKWLEKFLDEEEKERAKRSLERRIKEAQIGQFKPMSEFDWSWPEEIDRAQVEDLFSLEFLNEKANVVLVATNGLGKTMISENLAYQALIRGCNSRIVKASTMLGNLLQCSTATSRKRMLQKICRTELLVIDEVGYMSYDARYADLLYEVVSERYRKHSTIVTTNKAFTLWGEIFPDAACVVTLVDRLVHHAEIVVIKGKSWRCHEAEERAKSKAKARKAKTKSK
jgi:DNA replication protein DnaC